MATPNWDLVTVRGRFVNSDGSPTQGRVIFTPKVPRLVDAAAKRVIIGTSTAAVLDSEGKFEVALPASDDPDITPTGFTWQVREDFAGGVTYEILVPLASAAVGVDLATVAPTSPNTGSSLTPVTRLEFEDLRDLVMAGGGGGGGGHANLIPFSPTGTIASTTVQSAVAEVATEAASALSTHMGSSSAHTASQVTVSGISGFPTVQSALTELFTNGGGGSNEDAVLKNETWATAPSAPIIRRTINYTLATNQQNLFEVRLPTGGPRMWLNEWGALRGRVPYASFADALARAIIEPGDYTGTAGTGGNAFEIVNRNLPDGVGRQVWGRRWATGQLIRNGIGMADAYIRNGSDPIPSNLPAGTIVITTLGA